MEKCKGSSREDVLEQMRNLAYNDFPTHSFSLDSIDATDRLKEIEKTWVAGGVTSKLETLFSQACYERHHDSLNFIAREKYLFAAADAEVRRKADEVEERLRVAAEKAKEAARKEELARENALINDMTEAELGPSLANELEQALMSDPTCYDPSEAPTPIAPTSIFRTPADRPKLTAAGFRRPGGGARVRKLTVTDYLRDYTDGNGKPKHHVGASDEQSAKRSCAGRTPLRDTTNIPSPFLKENDIQDPFLRHLINRPARLPRSSNAPRTSINGIRLDRPMSRTVQRLTGLAASRQVQRGPVLRQMRDLTVAEPEVMQSMVVEPSVKVEEESEEEL